MLAISQELRPRIDQGWRSECPLKKPRPDRGAQELIVYYQSKK
jgi:hypothetical protein